MKPARDAWSRSPVLRAFVALVAVTATLWLARLLLGPRETSTVGPPSPPSVGVSSPAISAAHRPAGVPVVGPEPVASSTPTSEAANKLRELEEILASRNDNDPRLDTEFNHLSEDTKNILREKYVRLPREKLNERGTVVFLLGRNLTTEADLSFLADVIASPPCLSPLNCARRPEPGAGSAHAEQSSGLQVTLAYPQIVAIKALEEALAGTDPAARVDASLRASAIATIARGLRSDVPEVREAARQAQRRIGG